MITCPQCGQEAGDDARFCDRCGQGLTIANSHPVESSVQPLNPGTVVKDRYRITELASRTAHENRYRAVRIDSGEPVQLREQQGPTPHSVSAPVNSTPVADEDPAGPRAKTAELRLDHSADINSNDGQISEDAKPESKASGVTVTTENHSVSPSVAPDTHVETHEHEQTADEAPVHVLTDAIEQTPQLGSLPAEEGTRSESSSAENGGLNTAENPPNESEASAAIESEDLGEVFGRVLALSMTMKHPAFQRASVGFADNGRVYLVYPAEQLTPLSARAGGLRMGESEALQLAIQVCQAVSFVHRRGLRVNDLCPDSVAIGADGRVKLTGLDYVSNDNELQSEPIFNDGYTAPEIYRGKKADKRADIFSIGALLYTCLTGERLDSETWREEAGPIRFYPPHVITPALEQVLRRALQFDPGARWPNVEALKTELVKLAATIRLQSAALTDVGMIREHNEDAVLAFEYRRDSLVNPEQTFLYVVADGMGGAEAGEVASAIAIEAIRNHVEHKTLSLETTGRHTILQEALEEANKKILEYQTAHPEARGMGSTAVAALLDPPDAAISWVGDSRAYIRDGNGLRQLTKDHSLVQRLIEIGQITPEEARHHEHKNVITRSLGARPTGPAGAESFGLHLKRGDQLLLCSDGLTTHVDDRQIDDVLRRHSEPAAAARELVVAANAGGGTDNVSVVVIIAG